MKNFLAVLLALVFTTSIASAASATTSTNLRDAIKKDITSTKDAIKKDLQNADKENKARRDAQNKDK